MTKDEALKLALEALEVATTPMARDRQEVLQARAAIKEVLAQPAQKPVAFISPGGHIHYDPYLDSIPLYTAPPQRTWVGLTDEQMETTHWSPDFRAGAKWAEAKIKEKNG